jgi:hypothetical protein
MISWAWSDDQMSYDVANATPLVGTVTLKLLVTLPSWLTGRPM